MAQRIKDIHVELLGPKYGLDPNENFAINRNMKPIAWVKHGSRIDHNMHLLIPNQPM